MEKSLAVEATVFWILVSAVIELMAPSTRGQFAIGGAIVGVLNLVIAYFCWKLKRFAFAAAVILNLIVAIGAFPYPPPSRTVETPFGALIDALVILWSLLTVFFGYRAFRELRPA